MYSPLNLGHFPSVECAASKDFFFLFTLSASNSALSVSSLRSCVFCGMEVSALCSDEDQRECVLLLAEEVLMSPGRVRSWPYHDSHYSPLFLHDDVEQIDRLKKNISSISSALESNLCPATIGCNSSYRIMSKVSVILYWEQQLNLVLSYSAARLEIKFVVVSDWLCLQCSVTHLKKCINRHVFKVFCSQLKKVTFKGLCGSCEAASHWS